jgi:2-polyprenyl-6-methoxyphenol hydroxylase-like FAD-dependent oxidoreductase
MTPGLGQGACTALEDAVALAVALGGAPDPAAGLRRYELRRIPRTARITRISRRALEGAQWANPLAVSLRSLLLRLPPAAVARRQAWLFAYDAATAR